jgi:hypothetical protein
MADFAGMDEAEEIAKMYANYPPVREIIGFCIDLGIKKDDFRTIEEAGAWAYYHELKAKVAQHQRKTA